MPAESRFGFSHEWDIVRISVFDCAGIACAPMTNVACVRLEEPAWKSWNRLEELLYIEN